MLSGCGGSDSSGTDSTPVPVPVPVPEPVQTLTLKTETENQCVEATPYADATLVFHNENGDVIEQIPGKSDGLFSVSIPAAAKHVSILGKTKYIWDRVIEGDEITTFLDVQSGDLGIVRFVDYSVKNNCGCRDVELDAEALLVNYSGHLIGKSGLSKLDINRTQVSTEICSSDNNILGIQLVSADYKTSSVALIDMTGKSEYQLEEADFSHQGIRIIAAPNMETLSSLFTAYKLKTNPSLAKESIEKLHSPFIYPSIDGYAEFLATGNLDNARFTVKTRVTDNADISTLLPLNFNESNKHLKTEISQAVLGNTYPISYDFSSLDDKVSQFRFALDYYNESNSSVYWKIYGGASGSLPDLQFPTTSKRLSQINIVAPSVGITAYQQAYDLQALRAAIAKRQHSSNWQASSPLETSRGIHFTIQN